MASNKKIFQIEINGIEESTRSVDALTEKIKNLQGILSSIPKVEIPVELSGDIEKLTKQLKQVKDKVNKSTNNKGQIAEEKELIRVLEQRKKALDAVNKTLGDTGKNSEEFKKETKKLVAEATKARNEAEGYANTLNGLKKELKDLNNIKGDIDLGSEEYIQVSERIYEITQRLKDYEAAMGSHGRNVGNYTESISEAAKEMGKFSDNAKSIAEDAEELKEKFDRIKGVELNPENVKKYGISINDLKWQIGQLEKELQTLTIGSDEWNQTNQSLLNLKQTLGLVQKEMEAAIRAEDQLNTKIKVNVNGLDLVFDDVNQGIGILEDKMYALAAAGKRDTKEFQDMAKAAADLKTQVKAVDIEIDTMVEGGSGINKMLSYAKGFTSLATGAQGISQLFGGSEDTMKGVQTMTALLGIMEALRTVSQEMQQGTKFGQMLENWLDKFKKLTIGLQTFSNNLSTMQTLLKSDLKFQDIYDTQYIDSAIALTSDLRKEYEAIRKVFIDLGKTPNDGFAGLEQALSDLHLEGKLSGEQFNEINTRIRELETSANNTVDDMLKLNDSFGSFGLTLKGVGGLLKTAVSDFGKLLKNLNPFKRNLDGAAQGSDALATSLASTRIAINGVARAVKALKLVLKSLIIFAIIDALITLVGWLQDGVKWMIGLATESDTLVDSLGTVQARLDNVSSSLDKFIKQMERLKAVGKLTELEADAEILKRYQQELDKSVEAIKGFVKARDDMKSLEEGSKSDDYTFFGSASSIDGIEDAKERIDAFTEAYKELLDAVESGSDESKNWFSSWFFTKSDAKSDLGVMQKRVIDDIQYRINNLDLSKGEKELEKFFKKLDEEMYATSLANIENLYPEEEWAKVLKERLQAVREMYESMNDLSASSAIKQFQNEKSVSKQIRDNNVAAMEDEYQREKKELENRLTDELIEVKDDEELKLSIKAKYRRLEKDLEKQHAKDLETKRKEKLDKQKKEAEELASVLKQIRDNNLSLEEESLEKRIKLLENSKQDEIEAAKIKGIMVNEVILSIEQKYNKLVEKERKNHLDYITDLAEEYARKEIELKQAIKASNLDAANETADIQNAIKSQYGSFDFNAQYGERIKAEKEFAKQRLNIELDYLNEKLRIDKEFAQLESEDNLIAETQRYDDRLAELKSYFEEGKLNQTEYNQFIEKENKLHSQKIEQIKSNTIRTLKNIELDYQNEVKEKTSKNLTDIANLYSQYQLQVSDILEKVGTKRNVFGVISYNETKEQLQKALEVTRQGVKAIDDEMDALENKYKKGDISFIDYKDARQELQDTKKALEEDGKKITDNLSTLFSQVGGQWKGLLDSWVSQISSLLSTLNDTQSILIDNQIAEIEREMEIQQEAYDRAEEAANAHKDKMNDIEDELVDARGSRRQFLIDTLAAQQQAYLEDLAAQQKAEKEKEKLEERQKALEKKRREQEKKANVQQAIINTYTAVSNALAVQPWAVGLALSTVALALGLKNVAAIKGTPIYEDGGVIQGARHSQGGVKVLGGQAEVEGGEYITNRKSTAANLPLLTFINDKKRAVTAEEIMQFFANGTPRIKSNATRRFASGGQLPTTSGTEINRVVQVTDIAEDNTTYVVSVVDIINETNNLKKVQALSGLAND